MPLLPRLTIPNVVDIVFPVTIMLSHHANDAFYTGSVHIITVVDAAVCPHCSMGCLAPTTIGIDEYG